MLSTAIVRAVQVLLTERVREAQAAGRAVVALESTIVAHGFPRPDNLDVARAMCAAVRDNGAVPAIVAVIDGALRCGLTGAELERLALSDDFAKCAARDLGVVMARGGCGATTVSATCAAAALAGVQVFATGGIGGVHRGAARSFDESADLGALARWPVAVVSAGAKAILDLPATVERLETLSVPVIGFGCDRFPAFYSPESAASVAWRVDDVPTLAAAWRAHRHIGGMLICNPVPAGAALPAAEVRGWIDEALRQADREGVRGKAVTPFVLSALVGLSGGRTLGANRALAVHNAALGARLAVELAGGDAP